MKKIILLFLSIIAVSFSSLSQCGTTFVPSVTITSTANTICAGTPVTFTATPANGLIVSYQWWINGVDIASATNSTYTTSTAQNGDNYRVNITSSDPCASPSTVSSNVIVTTITQPITAGTISTDQTICAGTTPVPLSGAASTGGTSLKYYKWQSAPSAVTGPWTTLTAYTTATGFTPGALNQTTYYRRIDSSGGCFGVPTNVITITVTPPVVPGTISADQTICIGTTPAPFTGTASTGGVAAKNYKWQSTTVAFTGPWVTVKAYSTTGTGFAPGALTATTYYRRIDSSGVCNEVATNAILITVKPAITPGTIGTDQTVCYNTAPNPITELSAATGVTSSVVYTWETSPNGTLWTNTNQTGPSIAPQPLTVTTWFRRVATDATVQAPCNVAYSNAVKIIVTPDLTAGVISGDETLCEGTAPAVITSNFLPTGGNGTYTYGWESSTTGPNGSFTIIAGATDVNYYPSNLTTTTYYRRRETNACKTMYSNVVTKTVSANTVVSVTINNPGQTCAGTPITFTAAPTGGGVVPIYQWSKDGIIVGTSSGSYTFTPVIGDNGKYLTATLTSSNGCNTGKATSIPVKLDIVDAQPMAIAIETLNNPKCVGVPSTFTIKSVSGEGPTPTYKWFVNSISVGTAGTFNSSGLVNGDQVWVEMTSSLSCIMGPNPVVSNKITMVIKSIPNPVITESDKTICAGNSFTFNASVGSGNTLQWKKDGAVIPGATNSSYAANQTGQYAITEDNGSCNFTSAPVSLSIDPCGGFSTSILGPHPIASGQLAAIYKVYKQNGFAYLWSVLGGKIVSGQGTNSITVDWDPFTVDANARVTTPVYSVSVTETNPDNIQKTTTLDVRSTATTISKSLAQSGITLFPNPTAESFNIEMPESGVAVSYEIFDLTGASVAKGSFVSTSTAEKITTNFGAGMYQVILRYNDVVTCGRLSKVQ